MSRRGRSGFGIAVGLIACAGFGLVAGTDVRAETVESALVLAYQNNPSLNSQRAAVRVTDENVPQALSGYRPRATITASGGEQSLSTTSQIVPIPFPQNLKYQRPAVYHTDSGYNAKIAQLSFLFLRRSFPSPASAGHE